MPDLGGGQPGPQFAASLSSLLSLCFPKHFQSLRYFGKGSRADGKARVGSPCHRATTPQQEPAEADAAPSRIAAFKGWQVPKARAGAEDKTDAGGGAEHRKRKPT